MEEDMTKVIIKKRRKRGREDVRACVSVSGVMNRTAIGMKLMGNE